MQLTFNLYGLIIGISLVVGSSLIEKNLGNEKLLNKYFYKLAWFSFLFAVIGARLWHVVTDFYLYKNDLFGVFKVWNGGLSILGGVLGGIFGLILAFYFYEELRKLSFEKKKKAVVKLMDYSVFGLPVGQAIGRWGNYFNQELYGKPTESFLKIFIDAEHRFYGYEQFSYYHPLFFYEMFFTGLFAIIFYLIWYKQRELLPKIGTGKIFLLYALYYSIVRFFLDFLRIDKTTIFNGFIGTNQFILLFIIFFLSLLFFKRIEKNK